MGPAYGKKKRNSFEKCPQHNKHKTRTPYIQFYTHDKYCRLSM